MLNENVERLLKQLEATIEQHLQICHYMMKADSAAIFPVDMLTQAVLHRSIAMIRGFSVLLRDDNYLAAVSLVRLHLDNLLRLYALFIAPDAHGVVMEVLRGKEIRDLRDRDGNRMTDGYLVKRLSCEFPWVRTVYSATCGLVHLSGRHMHFTHGAVDEQTRSMDVCVSGKDFRIDDAFRIEAIAGMHEITVQILRYAFGWAHTKEVVGASRNNGAREGKGPES